jgi:hypothetical protein
MKPGTYRPKTGAHEFTVAELDGLLIHRTRTADLCFWPCPYGKNEVVFEGFVKCDGGIRHLVHRYDRVALHRAELDTQTYGAVSPRPYRLGQACDGSISAGVLALFHRWCLDRGHSPDALHRLAYQREDTPDWPHIVEFAEWQGVVYPARWGDAESVGLLESLHATNYHGLAGEVVEGSVK